MKVAEQLLDTPLGKSYCRRARRAPKLLNRCSGSRASAKSPPIPADFGHVLTNIDEVLPHVVTAKRLGQFRPGLAPALLATLGRNWADIGGYGPTWAELGQMSANLGRDLNPIGYLVPELVEPRPWGDTHRVGPGAPWVGHGVLLGSPKHVCSAKLEPDDS